MGGLIKAEFRKILTTKMWWALLIPTVLVGFAWALGVSAVITEFINDASSDPTLREFGVRIDELPWSVVALSRGVNIATVFPMVFAAMGVASEIRRRTITISFLTATTRGALLGAKAIVYLIWGLIYGLVIVAMTSLGTALGSDSQYLPGASDWILIMLSGLLTTVLWTLLALGIGALFGSTVASLVVLLIYSLFVGPVGDLIMTGYSNGSYLAGSLPNGAANGITGSTASQLLFDHVENVIPAGATVTDSQREGLEQAFRAIAGAPGAFALWISAAIFLGWTLLFFVGGLWRNRYRDIT